ncbi:MAG: hypothetical protein OEQ39_16125 [Gammaproteobacteria bacterium]|nr:hypothetical protein [Gammaproteobacteria bacterium]MDH3465723.1 hypothetical protein [Gammaproteobacteria bacterium]
MVTRSILTAVGIVLSSLLTFAVYAQQQTTQPGSENPGTGHAINRTVNPEVFANLMGQMMTNPIETMTNSETMCLDCHSADDLQKIYESFGAMLQPGNPMIRTNPSMYDPTRMRPMDPETYTNWYNAWMKKFGGVMNEDNSGQSQ